MMSSSGPALVALVMTFRTSSMYMAVCRVVTVAVDPLLQRMANSEFPPRVNTDSVRESGSCGLCLGVRSFHLNLDTSYIKGLFEILIVTQLQNLRLSNDTVASLSTLDPATLLNYYTVPRRQHGQDLHADVVLQESQRASAKRKRRLRLAERFHPSCLKVSEVRKQRNHCTPVKDKSYFTSECSSKRRSSPCKARRTAPIASCRRGPGRSWRRR